MGPPRSWTLSPRSRSLINLVAQLLKEKDDEIKHKEFCVEEFNSKQLQTKRTDRENEDLIAKIEDLEFTMKTVD